MPKEKINRIRKSRLYPLLAVPGYVLAYVLQYLAIELSCQRPGELAGLPFICHVIAIVGLMFVGQLLLLITGSVRWSLTLGAVFTTVLAVGNYYVYLLHGTPFTFALMTNVNTALDVLSAYEIRIGKRVLFIVGLGIFQILWAWAVFYKGCWNRKKSLIPGVLLLGAVYGLFVGGNVIPRDVVGWSWTDAISRVGYTNSLIQATLQSGHATIRPQGYDEKALEDFTRSHPAPEGDRQHPDLILILNETFFDLRQIADVDPDGEFLPVIENLPNTVRGYAVVPGIGGGTNKSEFELLTSNTLQVAPNITPFNFFDMQQVHSVVSLLEGAGYETFAAHNAPASNYNREVCYPDMGFDQVKFEGDFENSRRYFDHRFPTDESVYENMLEWYGQMGEGPRFFYMLTIQNHGGYTFLKDENVTVHTQNDFGEHTGEVDQFMTLISQSDRAFGLLTDALKESERDVIVCMVGDHGPSFIREIADDSLTPDQWELGLRSTPFIIWSNHIDLTGAQVPERISMPFLVPTVLELGDMPLSGYYDFLLELRDQVPVVSAYGSYQTADGKIGRYADLEGDRWDIGKAMGFSYADINGIDFMDTFARAS